MESFEHKVMLSSQELDEVKIRHEQEIQHVIQSHKIEKVNELIFLSIINNNCKK
jgi:hypothetical protein